MGFIDKLNQLTSEMNNVADKITGCNNQQVSNEQNYGLEGLGNININNANCTVSSPYGYLNKVDNSTRILETDMSKFSSNSDYANYIKEFLGKTEGFVIVDAEEGLKQQLSTNDIFYVQHNSGFNFIVIACLEYIEAQRIIDVFATNNITINNTTKVLIGYFNYDNNTIRLAKNIGFEMIGASEMFEINSDAKSSIIPDLNFGAKHNSLKAIIGRALRNEYLSSKQSSGQNTGIDGLAASVENTVNNVTGNIENALNGNDKNNINIQKSSVSLNKDK